MIQSISNSSNNLEPVKILSSQISNNSAKLPQPLGLSTFSSSTQEIVIKESLNLLKGIAIDLLRAALTSLTQTSTATGSSESKNDPAITPSSPNIEDSATDSAEQAGQAAPPEASTPRKNEGLSSFLQRELKPNGKGELHEEQLQYGIAGYLLNEKSPALYKQYQSALSDYKSQNQSRFSYEDGVKIALKDLVSSKKLSVKEAEEINGKSFRAAQLDKDLSTLFDDKGGAGDNTIAVLNSKEAAEKVDRLYGRIRRGELGALSRSLEAPSNSKSNAISTKNAVTLDTGFLWKPISESDGKLVILTPKNISKDVESVSIYKKDSNGKRTLIEKGKPTGIANGDRAHFRFKKAGASYPDGAVVEIKLKGGEVISETIKETSGRLDK